jgi:protein TonB
MFESTLEAQREADGDRRLGTLSAAALAHVGFALAIVVVTAVIVPKVSPPEPPVSPFPVVAVLPPDLLAQRPAPVPAPKKGDAAVKPGRTVVPPRDVPEVPPVQTPDSLPTNAKDDAPDDFEGPGDGTSGDLIGSPSGIPGGVGDGGTGPGSEEGAAPVEVTGDMVRPVLLVKVEPSYPQVARRAGLGGRVTVRAVIAENGDVESVEVFASTNPLFNDAAVDAVRRWRYRPALMNGRPVRVYFSVRVDFLVR